DPNEVKARINAHLKSRETEKLRIEAERLRTAKDMVTTYNHNMNQPLAVIYTYITILAGKFDKTDKTYATIAKIRTELDKINNVLKKIQSISEVKRKEYYGAISMVDLDDEKKQS
ncbi:MAG: hypothetical protein HQL28_07355, partial [Candidatus Omnitrophica bacterium]|nr:hypothetical protein [Candidatus Omnitrophota bacterium]